MRIDYRPGEWLALASPSGLALLEGGADPSLVRSLWSLVSGGGTLGEGLEAVSSRRPGTTLSSLPPFALVFVDDAGAHFACRGPVGIVVELAEAKVCMSGAGVASWREEHTAVPVAVTVTPEAVGRGRRAAKPTEGRTLELTGGMVLTAMVKLSVSDRVEDEDRPVDGPGESAESADRATPAAGAGLDGAGGAGTGIGGPVQGALPHTPDGAAPQGQSVETIAPGPTLLGNLYGQAPEPDPFPSPAVPEHDSYDHLFDAATVRDGVESAAVRPVSGEGEAEGQASASSVPEASPQDDDYDPDGVTIKGLGPGRAMARSFSAPQGAYVLGRVCVCGVANPPRRTECSSCGAPLTGDAVSVSRPALGYALVTPGERYELTRPLILGRRPRSARFGPQNTPILVTVPSPSQDISRSHLGIELEDWSVLVVDLGATNSTILRRAGVADRRLNSKEQVLAKNGDVYDLGDGVTVAIGGIP